MAPVPKCLMVRCFLVRMADFYGFRMRLDLFRGSALCCGPWRSINETGVYIGGEFFCNVGL